MKVVEDRKDEILEATCRVIARVGLHGVYIRHVADEAHVSRALVSYYFPSRSQLLASALEYAEVRAIDEIGMRVGPGSARDRIRETLMLEIDDSPAVRDNWVIWSEMTQAALFDDYYRSALAVWSKKWIDNLAAMVAEGHADGSIPLSVDPGRTGERLTATVDGIGLRWLLGLSSQERAHELLEGAVETELS